MFGLEQEEEDVDFYFTIEAHGFTLEEAIALKKVGSLPESLAKAWDKYDEWLTALEE